MVSYFLKFFYLHASTFWLEIAYSGKIILRFGVNRCSMLKLNILTPKEHIFGKNMPTNQVWCDASNGATCGREEETEKKAKKETLVANWLLDQTTHVIG